jgi:hypothetical protein
VILSRDTFQALLAQNHELVSGERGDCLAKFGGFDIMLAIADVIHLGAAKQFGINFGIHSGIVFGCFGVAAEPRGAGVKCGILYRIVLGKISVRTENVRLRPSVQFCTEAIKLGLVAIVGCWGG